jgi:hypothetical protein
MQAQMKEIPVVTSRRYQWIHIEGKKEQILQINGVLPIPVCKVKRYLNVSPDTVKRMISRGEINSYDIRFNKLPRDYKGKAKKFINLNEWAG